MKKPKEKTHQTSGFTNAINDPYEVTLPTNRMSQPVHSKDKHIDRTIPIMPIPFVPGDTHVTEVTPGRYFPAKLAIGFGMAKIILGILEVCFGVIALFVNAELSGFGGGLWAGTVVAISGSLGVFAGRHSHKTPHILSFLFASMLCVAITGLLVIFTATGLAKDATAPAKIVVDSDGHRIPFLGEVNSRTPAVLVNMVLLIMAIISCILAIFCCLICMREACQCYTSFWELSDHLNGGDSQTRKDRLVSWLEQQASEESGSQKSQSPRDIPQGSRDKNRTLDLEESSARCSIENTGRYKVSKKYSNDSQVSTSTTRTQLSYNSSEDYAGRSDKRETIYKQSRMPESATEKKLGSRMFLPPSSHYQNELHHIYPMFSR